MDKFEPGQNLRSRLEAENIIRNILEKEGASSVIFSDKTKKKNLIFKEMFEKASYNNPVKISYTDVEFAAYFDLATWEKLARTKFTGYKRRIDLKVASYR